MQHIWDCFHFILAKKGVKPEERHYEKLVSLLKGRLQASQIKLALQQSDQGHYRQNQRDLPLRQRPLMRQSSKDPLLIASAPPDTLSHRDLGR